MNQFIEVAYRTGRLVEPCGMNVRKTGAAMSAQLGRLDFESLSNEPGKRTVIGAVLKQP
jgi:hypothetical protein